MKEFGRVFSEENLSNLRRFYLEWRERAGEFPRQGLGYRGRQGGQAESAKALKKIRGQL